MTYESMPFELLPQATFDYDGETYTIEDLSDSVDVELSIPALASKIVGGYQSTDEPSWYVHFITIGGFENSETDSPEGVAATEALNADLRNRDLGTQLVSGFMLKALSKDVHVIDMTIENTHMFGLLRKLVDESRLSYYVQEQYGERQIIDMDVEQAEAKTAASIADNYSNQFVTRVDLNDLSDEEYNRLRARYLGLDDDDRDA